MVNREKKWAGSPLQIRLRTARDQAGLSSYQAAEALAVGRTYITDVEGGRIGHPRVERLLAMARLYGVSAVELLKAGSYDLGGLRHLAAELAQVTAGAEPAWAQPLEHKPVTWPDVDVSGSRHLQPELPFTRDELEGGSHHRRWPRRPASYPHVWEMYQAQWEEQVRLYEARPDGFWESWHYLDGHPMSWRFESRGDGSRPVNHVTFLVSDGAMQRDVIVGVMASRERGTEIWLETGEHSLFPGEHGHESWHDWELDVAEATYEEAVIALAKNVWVKYGNDRQRCHDTGVARPAGSALAREAEG